MSVHHAHRIPRARIDTIACAADALALIQRVLAVPASHETIVIVLDDAHRGLGIVSVSGTSEPDQVVTVVECIARPDLFGGEGAALVVASNRPAGAVTADDIDRWFEMCDLSEVAGVELVEWFVIGRSVSCPRDLVGAPPRWRGGAARSA
jgi:hypothetical protein